MKSDGRIVVEVRMTEDVKVCRHFTFALCALIRIVLQAIQFSVIDNGPGLNGVSEDVLFSEFTSDNSGASETAPSSAPRAAVSPPSVVLFPLSIVVLPTVYWIRPAICQERCPQA